MADARLEVQVGADIKDLNAGFALAGEAVKKFAAVVDAATAKLDAAMKGRFVAATQAATQSVEQTGESAKRAANNFSILASSTTAPIAGFKSIADAANNSLRYIPEQINKASVSFKLLSESLNGPVAGFKNLTTAATTSFSVIGRVSASAQQPIKSFATNVQSSMAQVDKAVAKNGQGWVNVSRVIQDLPYGFQGIQNNLTQLIPGVGALGLAFTAVVTAITFAQTGLSFWVRKSKDAGKATEDLKKQNDAYIESLNDVAQAHLKGDQSAQEELTTLNILYARAKDVSLSYQDRTRAVNELQKQYPKYFANMRDETIMVGGAEKSYRRLTETLIASAKARAAAGLLTEISKNQLVNQQKINDYKQVEIQAEQELVRLQNTPRTAKTDNSELLEKIGDADRKRVGAQTLINQLTSANNVLEKRKLDLLKAANIELNKADSTLTGDTGAALPKAPKVKRKDLEYFDTSGILDLDKRLREKYKKAYKEVSDGNKAIQLAITEPPTAGLNSWVDKVTGNYLDRLDEFNSGLRSLTEQGVSYIGDFFSGIGEAMAMGDFSNFGQNILQAFAGFLGQLGQLFIKQGIAEIAFGMAQNIILPGSGARRIAGGIGMVAAGGIISVGSGLISGAAKKGSASAGGQDYGYGEANRRPAFAGGVTAFRGGMALVGERGPEMVRLPAGSGVVPNHKLSAFGRQEQVFILESRLSGQDIYLSAKRVEKHNSRVY